MLEVTFFRDDRNRFAGFAARGHAGFAAHGEDIICAAVSAILQAARLGLHEYARVDVASRQAPGELRLEWRAEDSESESVRAIVTTAELAIGEIARRFPSHVSLKRASPRAPAGSRVRQRVTKLADRRRSNDV
jgi:uncharacterized protein